MSAEYANARRRAMEPWERSENANAPSGWAESAAAWIIDIGEEGDYGRACVLDRPMLERIHGRRFATALDVGCGEGASAECCKSPGFRPWGSIRPRNCSGRHAAATLRVIIELAVPRRWSSPIVRSILSSHWRASARGSTLEGACPGARRGRDA